MEENKQPTQYQTGSTTPPKSRAGIIAFLLAVVIFLCGISTILSLMRINLLQKAVSQAESQRSSFSFVAQKQQRTPTDDSYALGFLGQATPKFWQSYCALPEGIYITQTQSPHSLRPGDVLLTLDGQQVRSWEALLELAKQYAPGDSVRVTVYREGSRQQLHITINQK